MATYDATKNFAKVTVSTGYDDTATSIVLSGGDGAKLPQPSTDGEFNLVWWNNTDYGDPSDDPNKEIVRCTARTTDTLTVTRNQESTGASIKNIASKTYRMALTITAKVIDDITDSIGGSTTLNVAQFGHGFAVGDVLRSSGTDNEYTEAQADSAANAEVTGIVTEVVDTNNFVMTTSGPITEASAVPSQTAGTVMFLDPDVAGALTATAPTDSGEVSKPIAIITEDNAEMIFINWRGTTITDGDLTSGYQVLASVSLDSASNTLESGTIPAKKFLKVIARSAGQTSGRLRLRFNGDTGANYDHREGRYNTSPSGTAGATVLRITTVDTTNPLHSVCDIVNLDGHKKSLTGRYFHVVNQANNPGHCNGVWRTTSGQITSIQLSCNTGTMNSGTVLLVLGTD